MGERLARGAAVDPLRAAGARGVLGRHRPHARRGAPPARPTSRCSRAAWATGRAYLETGSGALIARPLGEAASKAALLHPHRPVGGGGLQGRPLQHRRAGADGGGRARGGGGGRAGRAARRRCTSPWPSSPPRLAGAAWALIAARAQAVARRARGHLHHHAQLGGGEPGGQLARRWARCARWPAAASPCPARRRSMPPRSCPGCWGTSRGSTWASRWRWPWRCSSGLWLHAHRGAASRRAPSGLGPEAARAAGISVKQRAAEAMALAGALAGLAGAVLVLGTEFSYPGVARRALRLRRHRHRAHRQQQPAGRRRSPRSSSAVLRAGGTRMQLLGVHKSFPELIQGLALLFVAGRMVWLALLRRRTRPVRLRRGAPCLRSSRRSSSPPWTRPPRSSSPPWERVLSERAGVVNVGVEGMMRAGRLRARRWRRWSMPTPAGGAGGHGGGRGARRRSTAT